uniref:Secreted protein n=1 Tax=Peronospora matthiolae TaxID=2874970 RepID=A0AAV1U9N4_9STRA
MDSFAILLWLIFLAVPPIHERRTIPPPATFFRRRINRPSCRQNSGQKHKLEKYSALVTGSAIDAPFSAICLICSNQLNRVRSSHHDAVTSHSSQHQPAHSSYVVALWKPAGTTTPALASEEGPGAVTICHGYKIE